MEDSSKNLCETILREKILSLQQEYEKKVEKLTQYFEEALAKLTANEQAKRQQLEEEHLRKQQELQREYCKQIKNLEEEINFLNERHHSQRLMLSETLDYVQQLELELEQLKNKISNGNSLEC